jgi:deazaflavin-dependent oxidoreductase (nitroreductase family)
MSLQTSLFVLTLRAHQTIYELSGGLVGHRILGLPTLLLRSTGRKSGEERTIAIVYVRDGDRYIIVPSNGGAKRPPAWLLNLESQPQAEIQIARDRTPVTATVIGKDDPDFERLWRLADDHNKGRYDAYQRQTDRPIPVVALTPA